MIPTDRVSLEELPEEKQPAEELVQEAFKIVRSWSRLCSR